MSLERRNGILEKFNKEHTTSRILEAQARNKKDVCQRATNKLIESRRLEGHNGVDKDKLIRQYAYLVNWIVSRLPISSLKGMDRDDLIGYGTIGLIEAVNRFDPTRNSSFESFAVARVKGSIYDQLRASDWLSRNSRKRVKNLIKATSELENRFSRYPTNHEIAKELSITQDELRIIQQEAQIGIFSLDEPRDNSDDSAALVDSISSNKTGVLEEIEENELKERLIKAIEMLPDREKTVVGLYHYKNLTFKEIAEIMEFSESRASQIHARAISLLKSRMLKE